MLGADMQGESEEKITHVQWCEQEDDAPPVIPIKTPSRVLSRLKARDYLTMWVKAYSEGTIQPFDMTYLAMGALSHPMQKLHAFLMEIPYGQTTHYGFVAQHIGSSPRAVGQMLRRNRFALIIPCHRITGQKGLLRGYGGLSGIERQRQLIDHERTYGQRYASQKR